MVSNRWILIPVAVAALLLFSPPPVAAETRPLGTSESPTPSDAVVAARDAVDAAVRAHRDALEELMAARERESSLGAEVASLDTRISELEPTRASEANRYAEARRELTAAAIASYVAGGSSAMRLAVLSGTGDLDQYAARLSLAGVVAGRLSDRARHHAAQAETLGKSLQELAATRGRLAAELDAARQRRETAEMAEAAATEVVDAARDALIIAMTSDHQLPDVVDGTPVAGIGPVALDAYLRAAARLADERPECRLPWWAVAAVGRVESGHGTAFGSRVGPSGQVVPPIFGPRLDGGRFAAIRDTDGGALDGDPEWDRAIGPMQFIPSSWVREVGEGVSDPQNIYDAALAAGRYLCRGARGVPLDTAEGVQRAALSYNRSKVYAQAVLSTAMRYASAPIGDPGPVIVAAPFAATPVWEPLGTIARLDLVPGRTVTATVDGWVRAAALIPQRSTLVLVSTPEEDPAVVGAQAVRAAESLMGRKILAVVPGNSDAVSVAAAVGAAWPGLGIRGVVSDDGSPPDVAVVRATLDLLITG